MKTVLQFRLDGSLQPSVSLCATNTVFYIFRILVSGMFGRDGFRGVRDIFVDLVYGRVFLENTNWSGNNFEETGE